MHETELNVQVCGMDAAREVMTHVRALRQGLLTSGPEPIGDQERSGLTAPQVAVMAHLSHSTTSGIVDRLQARGLVVRDPDPNDRRRTRIAVTSMVTDYVSQLAEGPFGRQRASDAGIAQAHRTVPPVARNPAEHRRPEARHPVPGGVGVTFHPW